MERVDSAAAANELERRAGVALKNNEVRIERRGRRAVTGVVRSEVRRLRLTPDEAAVFDAAGGVDAIRAMIRALAIASRGIHLQTDS